MSYRCCFDILLICRFAYATPAFTLISRAQRHGMIRGFSLLPHATICFAAASLPFRHATMVSFSRYATMPDYFAFRDWFSYAADTPRRAAVAAPLMLRCMTPMSAATPLSRCRRSRRRDTFTANYIKMSLLRALAASRVLAPLVCCYVDEAA